MTALSRIAPVAAAAALCGCAATATTTAPRTCSSVAAATDRQIATRIYAQAAGGRVVAGSVARVSRSAALAAAVAKGDPAATRAAVRKLTRGQIKRIVVLRGGRVLADLGDKRAIAPVGGTIPGTRGRFVLSDSTAAGVATTIDKLTATHVVVSAR